MKIIRITGRMEVGAIKEIMKRMEIMNGKNGNVGKNGNDENYKRNVKNGSNE